MRAALTAQHSQMRAAQGAWRAQRCALDGTDLKMIFNLGVQALQCSIRELCKPAKHDKQAGRETEQDEQAADTEGEREGRGTTCIEESRELAVSSPLTKASTAFVRISS